MIDAAILSLPVVVYKYRRRWFGLPAGIVWLASVATLIYYSVRGQGLVFVPALLTRSLPAWKALLIALAIGAIGAAFSRWRRAPRPRPAPSAREIWNDLSYDARGALNYVWTTTDGRISKFHVHELQQSLDLARWNTVVNELESRGLIRPTFGGREFHLTQHARDVLSRVPVVNEGMDSADALPFDARKEWLAQEARFKGLRGHVGGIWLRDEQSSEVTWNVTPMAGSSSDDLREFRAEAVLAGKLLLRAGLLSEPRADPEDDWLNAVRVLAESEGGFTLIRPGQTGRSIENLERKSALACTRLAGGARPTL